MSITLTSRSAAPNTGVLTQLAQRWRPAGLFLACFARDGKLVWQDDQMPRLLALSLTGGPALAKFIRNLGEELPAQPLTIPASFGGITISLVPQARRRKVVAWLAVLARTEVPGGLVPTEELARAAQRAGLDLQGLLIQSQRIPAVPVGQLPTLVALLEHMHEDMQSTAVQVGELSSVTEQLTSVYEEISLLYKISSGMRFSQKSETFIETVCREVQDIGNFRTVGVVLAQTPEDASSVTLRNDMVLVGHPLLPPAELATALHAPLQAALASGETQVYNELPEGLLAPRLRSLLHRFVCVPLVRDRRPLGVLVAIDKHDKVEFTSVDLKLLNNVGNQCSIFLENAALYQDMQGLFMGVLHALTRSIDAKDAYTRGHSQRVAELSRELARKIGLPEDTCERVYLSGLLHDVGKIGVPESVLTKPGRLTDAEFDAIKKHPTIGAQILGNIKQLQDIIPGVLYHHERWDGRGYPYNIAGENIPLLGRIICVADSFDAMSSTRTYRPALPLETVLGEIQRCAGNQFDPQLARVFITLDFTSHTKSVEEQLLAARLADTDMSESNQ